MAASQAIRWIRRIVASLAGAVAVLGCVVYIVSERELHRKYDTPLVDITIPTDSGAIAEGERLVAIRGCKGCHGSDLGGRLFHEDFLEGRAVAPNLTRVAADYSTAELERAIRLGQRELRMMSDVARSRFSHFNEDAVRVSPQTRHSLEYGGLMRGRAAQLAAPDRLLW